MATNQRLIDIMVNQPNNALLRKYSRLGYFLLLFRHMELGEMESDMTMVIDRLIRLLENKSDLQTAEIISRPEVSNDLKRVAELQSKFMSYSALLSGFHHVQSFPSPADYEIQSFKDSLNYQLSLDTKGTPWENEDDLVHAFPTRPDQLANLSKALVRKLFSWRNRPALQTFINWLPRKFTSSLTLPTWETGNGSATPVVLKRDSLLDPIATWATRFLAPTITVLPMFVLYAIPSTWVRIAAVWWFSFAFVCLLGFLISPSVSNTGFILSVNAAFCAVLGVFVGSSPN